MKILPALAVAIALGMPGASIAQTAAAPAAKPAPGAFTLPALPYAADALMPAIDAQTMTIHHDKHHQAYVDALNKAVAADAALSGKSLEQLVGAAGTMPAVDWARMPKVPRTMIGVM